MQVFSLLYLFFEMKGKHEEYGNHVCDHHGVGDISHMAFVMHCVLAVQCVFVV